MIVIAIAAAFVSSLVDASPIKDALFASHRWRASSNGTFEGPSLTKRSSTTNTRRQVRVDATRCDARSLFRSFVRYGQSEFVFRLIDSHATRDARATSLTDRLTDETHTHAVYATQSLVELARGLDDDALRDVCEHLTSRAENKSPYVKRKALRLIAKCAEDAGSRDRRFAREMAKVSGRIRALQTHVGTPHPSKGDSVNASVREAAREAMSAIFGSEREIHDGNRGDGRVAGMMGDGGVARSGGRITGFGDGSFASGGTTGGRLMSQEGGFGARSSPSSRSVDDEDSPRRGASVAATMTTARPGTLDAPLEASLASTPKLNIGGGGAKWKPLRPPSPERKREGGAGASRATAVDLLGDLDAAPSNARPAVVPASMAATNTSSRRAASSSSREDFNLDGSEEQRAIEKLCALSGVRISPAESDIDAFLRTGSRLNSKGVVVAIAEKLVTYAGDSWRVAYRAVCVLERSAQSDSTGRWLADVFVNSSAMDLLESITADASVHVQLKHKATTCVAALRSSSVGDVGSSASTTVAQPKPTAPTSSIDLLSQLGDLSVSAPPPVAASSSPNVLDDLFAAPAPQTTTSAPTGYRAPTAPMRGPGLAALDDIAPTSEEQKLKNTKAFDFVSDLMK